MQQRLGLEPLLFGDYAAREEDLAAARLQSLGLVRRLPRASDIAEPDVRAHRRDERRRGRRIEQAGGGVFVHGILVAPEVGVRVAERQVDLVRPLVRRDKPRENRDRGLSRRTSGRTRSTW